MGADPLRPPCERKICSPDIACSMAIRDHHATAVDRPRARGLRVHVFEEGYIAPTGLTYERGGTTQFPA